MVIMNLAMINMLQICRCLSAVTAVGKFQSERAQQLLSRKGWLNLAPQQHAIQHDQQASKQLTNPS